jgi:hypothetical protein
LCACNSAPKDSCAVPGHSVIASGSIPTTCEGTCAALPLASGDGGGDAGILFCTIDCTDGGQSECTIDGTTCISAQSKGFNIDKSFCLYACGTDDAGNDAGSCPSPYFCFTDAGVCL